MPRFHCHNTSQSCLNAIRSAGFNIEKCDLPPWPLHTASGSAWAKMYVGITQFSPDECEIDITIEPKRWARLIVQFIVLSLIFVVCRVTVSFGHASILDFIILAIAVFFAVCIIISGRIITKSLDKLALHLSNELSSFEQISPPQFSVKMWEWGLLFLWLCAGWIFFSITISWATGSIVGLFLLGVVYNLPSFAYYKTSFRVCLYIIEAHLTFSILMLLAAILVIMLFGFTQSMLSNPPEGMDIDAKYFASNVMFTEWHRAETLGVSDSKYGEILSNHINESTAAANTSKSCIVLAAVIMTIGFWWLRLNQNESLRLIHVDKPTDLTKPFLPDAAAVSRANFVFMAFGCLLAGVYRWLYVIFCIDITASLWHGESIIIGSTAWAVAVLINSLPDNSNYPMLWHYFSLACLQIIAIPGLLLLLRASLHMLSILVEDIYLKVRSTHSSPVSEEISRLVDNFHLNDQCSYCIVPIHSLPQVAEAEYSVFTNTYVIRVDEAACDLLRPQQLSAIILHEIYHLLHSAKRLAWYKIGSLMLLSPYFSLNVLFDFAQAEYDADAFAAQRMGNSSVVISYIYAAEALRSKRQAESHVKSARNTWVLHKVLSVFSFVSPIFLYNMSWAAAYPTAIQRLHQLSHSLKSQVQDVTHHEKL